MDIEPTPVPTAAARKEETKAKGKKKAKAPPAARIEETEEHFYGTNEVLDKLDLVVDAGPLYHSMAKIVRAARNSQYASTFRDTFQNIRGCLSSATDEKAFKVWTARNQELCKILIYTIQAFFIPSPGEDGGGGASTDLFGNDPMFSDMFGSTSTTPQRRPIEMAKASELKALPTLVAINSKIKAGNRGGEIYGAFLKLTEPKEHSLSSLLAKNTGTQGKGPLQSINYSAAFAAFFIV
jgi:hypothetical protein